MAKRTGLGCWFWGFSFVVGLPLLLLIIGALVFMGRERSARRELNSRLEQLAAAGMPIDDATLLDFTDGLTSREHTDAWLGVLKQFGSKEFKEAVGGVPLFDPQIHTEIPPPGEAWPVDKWPAEQIAIDAAASAPEEALELAVSAEGMGAIDGVDEHQMGMELQPLMPEERGVDEQTVRKFLARWSELHDRISQLSMKQLEPNAKGVRFIEQYDSVNTLLPQTQNMREAARLLSLHGQLALYDRDSGQARKSIEALIGCSKTISGEPILVSQLVTTAIESMSLELLKTGLEHDVFEEADLLALLPQFRSAIQICPEWKLAVQGERAMALPVFANPGMVGSGNVRIPARSRDTLHFLDHMQRILAIPDDDFDRYLAQLKAEEEVMNDLAHGSLLTTFDSILTNLMSPASGAIGGVFVRRAVQNRMAVLCMAARIYEKRNGKWPASLDDLKTLQLEGLVIDPAELMPAGGKPFGYKVEEERVVLWGGNLRLDPVTPPEPLKVTEGDPNAEENEIWIWTMRIRVK